MRMYAISCGAGGNGLTPMPESSVEVRAGGRSLPGTLGVPDGQPRGLVIFAHGSGSSRHSPRNRFVSAKLNDSGFATLLLDLLTAEEERVDNRSGELRFDIGLLAERMAHATEWARGDTRLNALP